MAIRGGFLRLVMITAYAIAFCCAAIITGAFAWFLVERDNSSNIASLVLGVLTLIYCAICILVTCCTAGTFLAYIGVLLDLVHVGLMMAVAIINRSATDLDSCEDFDNGRGGGGGRGGRGDRREVYSRLGRDDVDVRCGLYVAAFAVAIIAIFMFLITMVMQVLIRRGRGKKEVVVKA